ncbi:hypothetical protein SUGI_0041940 [Cryptomeria japonica]|nr:hypothetical protein SUGI_0041940 [Cryptomeria japonica]
MSIGYNMVGTPTGIVTSYIDFFATLPEFCQEMTMPLCPLEVVTKLDEVFWDTDIDFNGLPSTQVRHVFEEFGRYWQERYSFSLITSLAKGMESMLHPLPHII